MAGKSAFNAAEAEIRELFGDYLDGPSDCAAIVVSTHPASEVVRNALEKSFSALGFGKNACLHATTNPPEAEVPLDPQALFALMEGIDPPYVICTDEKAAAQLATAYHTTFTTDAYNRAFGRPAAVFANLDNLLATEKGKRKVWELLKPLPAEKS